MNVISRINNAQNVPKEIREQLQPIFDIHGRFFQENAIVLATNLIKLANYHNEATRFQALLFLSSYAFSLHLPENKLPKDFKPAYLLRTIDIMDKHFFVVNGFDKAKFATGYNELWNVFPLSDQSQYFVD